jgi:2,4-dienoyl-CoA reductase-like NADH-dependent reductase (Old Yellow Enzyme family)
MFPGEGFRRRYWNFPARRQVSVGWDGKTRRWGGLHIPLVARFCRAAQGAIIMAQSALFQPIRVGNLDLCNRIVIAPMCQYSAEDGCMTDWHLIHLGHLALSGAALLTIEATAVLPEGRITWADAGLWNDETEAAIGRTLDSIRRWSDIPIALQLAHAGRKASTEVPWEGGAQIAPGDPHGWRTMAPSAVPFADGEVAPVALDRDGLPAGTGHGLG